MEDKDLKDQLEGLFSGVEEAAEEGWGAEELGSAGAEEMFPALPSPSAPFDAGLNPAARAGPPSGDGRGRKGMVSALPQALDAPEAFALPESKLPTEGRPGQPAPAALPGVDGPGNGQPESETRVSAITLRAEPSTQRLVSRRGIQWRWIMWAVLGTLGVIMAVAYGQALFTIPGSRPESGLLQPDSTPRFVVPSTLTPRATPTVTATGGGDSFAILEPTATPTPVAGGRVLLLTPAAAEAGWLAGDDQSVVAPESEPANHLGDAFLYAGILNGKIHHAAIQFDLGQIPRGTHIHAASLRLTGLRADELNPAQRGVWRVQLLAPEIDYRWREHTFPQIHRATVGSSLEPALSGDELGAGRVNLFQFTPEQLALLERRLLEGSERTGKTVSFRVDGPAEGGDNLFAWDAGRGSQEGGPQLFLSLGPPPEETPAPYYVVITSTPTPENIQTAAANSRRMTAEAERVGTATPLPPNWVTPVAVTATPTAGNPATAQAMRELATAVALTTGQPPNLAMATATPTYVIITSTPTPGDIRAAAATAQQLTAEAERVGTATPLPSNWVTPLVVTATPTPENSATAEYLQVVLLVEGTPTPTPANMQTATPTATYVVITSTPTAPNVATAAAILLRLTAQATQFGMPTPLPPNWVTPLVVTSTPTPENAATAEYWQAVALTTGTPTRLPANAQTATPTPVYAELEGWLPTPLATETPTPTPAPIPRELVGKIAFLSDRALLAHDPQATPMSQSQVYVVNPDGSGLAVLPERWPYDQALARESFSADLRFQVTVQKAVHWENGTRQMIPALYVFDALYESEAQTTHFGGGMAYDPVWSPTAGEIAFVSNDSQNDEIWVIQSDGSGAIQLTRNEWEWDKHPSWSPDGQQIVFASNRTGSNQLWIMNRDGSGQRLLMEWHPYNDWDPVWIKYTDQIPNIK